MLWFWIKMVSQSNNKFVTLETEVQFIILAAVLQCMLHILANIIHKCGEISREVCWFALINRVHTQQGWQFISSHFLCSMAVTFLLARIFFSAFVVTLALSVRVFESWTLAVTTWLVYSKVYSGQKMLHYERVKLQRAVRRNKSHLLNKSQSVIG